MTKPIKSYNNLLIGELITDLLKTDIDKADIVDRLIKIDNSLSKYKISPVFREKGKFIVTKDGEPIDKYWFFARTIDDVEEFSLSDAFEFIEFLKSN